MRGGPAATTDRDGAFAQSDKIEVRAKVEHPFFDSQAALGFSKVRYRGMAKNANRLYVACALTNVVMAQTVLKSRWRKDYCSRVASNRDGSAKLGRLLAVIGAFSTQKPAVEGATSVMANH